MSSEAVVTDSAASAIEAESEAGKVLPGEAVDSGSPGSDEAVFRRGSVGDAAPGKVSDVSAANAPVRVVEVGLFPAAGEARFVAVSAAAVAAAVVAVSSLPVATVVPSVGSGEVPAEIEAAGSQSETRLTAYPEAATHPQRYREMALYLRAGRR